MQSFSTLLLPLYFVPVRWFGSRVSGVVTSDTCNVIVHKFPHAVKPHDTSNVSKTRRICFCVHGHQEEASDILYLGRREGAFRDIVTLKLRLYENWRLQTAATTAPMVGGWCTTTQWLVSDCQCTMHGVVRTGRNMALPVLLLGSRSP